MDSGCARSTTGLAITEDLGYAVHETAQSKNGHHFTGPGGERYPNRGSVELIAEDENAKICSTRFHVAEGIEQALGSVADMNDAENLVLFDNAGSYVVPGKGPEAAAIRKIMEKCKKATKIHRRKNTFYIPLWVQPEGKRSSQGQKTAIGSKAPFQGQGS